MATQHRKLARELLAKYPGRKDWQWQKIIPVQNCYRFYRISVEADLFDEQVVRKYAGRLGSKRCQQSTVCPSETLKIERILENEIRRRLQHQYTLDT